MLAIGPGPKLKIGSQRMPGTAVARRFPAARETSVGCTWRCPSGGAASLARLALSGGGLEMMGPVVGKIDGG